MLRLSDFVTCIKIYYNHSRGVYISAKEHCTSLFVTQVSGKEKISAIVIYAIYVNDLSDA